MPENQVLEQLKRILRSRPFQSSRKCSRFLRYVVEHRGEGEEGLRERTLGVEVYRRPPDYDTLRDPVVRTAAVETRKRLAQYYQEPGHEQEIRIDLPVGHYVPEIRAPQEESAEHVEIVSGSKFRVRGRWVGIGSITAVTVLCAILLAGRLQRSPLDRFWAPLVGSPGPVLLCVVQPRAFAFAPRLPKDLEELFGRDVAAAILEPANEAVAVGGVVPRWGGYVALNHARAMTGISRALIRRGKSVEIIGEPASSSKDVHERPTILIGPPSQHRLSSILTGELRFHLDRDENSGSYVIHDRMDSDGEGWRSATEQSDPPVSTEYAVISRVRSSVTGQPVVVAAGTRVVGTRGAAEFLTNESYFAKAVERAPANWYDQNTQIVLSMKVVDGEPGPPEVVTTHFW